MSDDAAEFMRFVEKFMAEVPGGKAGDLEMRRRDPHPFVDTTAADIRPDRLTDGQIHSWFDYMAWNLWELIASRSTEGESGLIPRQEYETLSFVQQWAIYPNAMRMITDAIGVDGLVDLGRVSKREVGTKVNHLRNYASALMAMLGRGVAVKLELEGPDDRRRDVETALQFGRRLWHGTWAEGPGLSSGRGFLLPHLDADVLEPLVDGTDALDDELRTAFRRFNATTELFGFMLHYDTRLGMGDTGPYPQPDGSFVLVRDHFLDETAYPWAAGVSEDMPYAVTEVMVFDDPSIQVKINDIGTTFTTPNNYLDSLSRVAVYARDKVDTPMSDLRKLGLDEMRAISKSCESATIKLYRTYGAASRDEKIWNGIQVYSHDFMRPVALRAGVWDEVRKQGFDEKSDLTEKAWPTLTGGRAAEILAPVFLMGGGFPRFTPSSDQEAS